MTRSLVEAPAFDFVPGSTPLLVSMPHAGTHVPACLRGRLTPECKPLGDTDWHLPRLYDFLGELGASVLVGRYTRFAVDLNRPPDDTPLYASATTGLHPETLFDGRPAFKEGLGLTNAEREAFMSAIWQPYHDRIAAELASLRARHGYAILFDAHSIAGEIPRLFQGLLPDFNLGTADGKSADPALTERLAKALSSAPRYRLAVNSRFKGGYITRNYGAPGSGVSAVQLELAQRTYMLEYRPYDYIPELADQVRPVLQRFVRAMLDWADDKEAGD